MKLPPLSAPAVALALPLLLAFAPPGGGAKTKAVPVAVDAISAQEIQAAFSTDLIPPDVGIAVGPTTVVQGTNLTIRGYDKLGVEVLKQGANAIYGGLGSPCYTTDDDTDANHMLKYDPLADQWVFAKMPRSGGHVCFGISQGSDPAGPYHLYDFDINVPLSGDNPQLSVWPDGYYMSYDVYDPGGTIYYGYHTAVFERTKMLTGDVNASWQQVAFPTTGFPPTHENVLPASMGGWGPPPGTPMTFAQKFDDQVQGSGSGSDGLFTWSFKVDWNLPFNTTITANGLVPTGDFDSLVGSLPQVGGTTLDPRADRLDSLQYWNHGAYQSLVGNHTVELGGRAGIRWFELRDSGSGWNLHQEGTFSPDSNDRWMGSIAMNKDGDIALGYTTSSASLFPSLRYVSRRAGDPLGSFTGPELEFGTGTSVQTGSTRWGDYSSIAVDPADDLTFWYTAQYGTGSGPLSWGTRVAALTATGGPQKYCTAKVNSCGTSPSLYYWGEPSATKPGGFTVGVDLMPAGKVATYLYTVNGAGTTPFEGGTLCLNGPLRRTPVVRDTFGTPGLCDGFISFDLNAFAQGNLGGKPAAFLKTPGIQIHGQAWGRDNALHGSFLSDAMEWYQGP